MIHFTVPGQPQGKGRPRFARFGSGVKTFTPEATANYEAYIKLMCSLTKPTITSEPVKMTIRAYFAVPKSYSEKKRQRALNGEILPTVKPDADNIVKVVCDALNGIVYDDDKQIVELEFSKLYAVSPRVEVSVEYIVS